MIKCILFDLDGTLTNPEEGITNSVAYSLNYFGINVDDKSQLRKFIGPPLKQSYMNFYGFDSDKADLAVSKYREYFAPKGIFENEVFDGIDNLLNMLNNNGIILAIATSKPTIYAKDIIKHFKLDKYFKDVYGSELDGRRTDKAEVIEYALNNIGIDRENVIMIGDRSHDIIGANKNGIKSIGVLLGFGSKEELQNADYIAKNVEDIYDIINKINN